LLKSLSRSEQVLLKRQQVLNQKMISKFCIRTLGCKVNQYESDVIAQTLTESGSVPTYAEGDSGLCIVNTCAVTQKAAMQSRQAVRQAIRNNPMARILVTGCYAQTEPDELKQIKGVHVIVGHKNKYEIPQLVNALTEAESRIPVSICQNVTNERIFRQTPSIPRQDRTRPILKIQDGCDASCTYCIVPRARGPSRSMPVKNVLDSIRELKQVGYHEVVLSGVHLGQYGLDLHSKFSLSELLGRICASGAIDRVRLSSIDPLEVSPDILKFTRKSRSEYGRLCRHFHIPLQSGDDFILKKMKRSYGRSFFRALVRNIQETIPDVAIGVDVLIGFPGETEEAFQNTYNLIYELPVAYLHVFPFSSRKGTPADTYSDKVPTKVIKARSRKMRELGDQKRKTFLTRFIGEKVEVLIERKATGIQNFFRGITSNYIPVLVRSNEDLRNTIIDVRIEKLHGGPTALGTLCKMY